MSNQKRIAAIQEAGGKLVGGTIGNVWAWGPQSAREDALVDMGDEEFEALMEHYADAARYTSTIAHLERDVDRLEGQVQDLKEQLPSDEHKAILEAIDDAKYNGQPGILKHLSATASAIADEYGYTSPEYAAICAITNAIAQ
jgi:hypothetical protein